MPSLSCFTFRFTFNWPMFILASLFLALFVRLGFWQIQRADTKEKMLAAQQALVLQAPKEWHPKDALPLQYQPIRVQGRYLPHLYFLDNQHYQHQFGYNVISPLELDGGAIVLIDRGWVAGSEGRAVPKVHTPEQRLDIQGTVYFPSANAWVLGPSLEKKSDQSTVVERLDTKLFTHVLQKKVYPFIIRLNKQDAYGFVREWAIVSMPPERHLAYALQWFAMALTILILFVALNLKKIK